MVFWVQYCLRCGGYSSTLTKNILCDMHFNVWYRRQLTIRQISISAQILKCCILRLERACQSGSEKHRQAQNPAAASSPNLLWSFGLLTICCFLCWRHPWRLVELFHCCLHHNRPMADLWKNSWSLQRSLHTLGTLLDVCMLRNSFAGNLSSPFLESSI